MSPLVYGFMPSAKIRVGNKESCEYSVLRDFLSEHIHQNPLEAGREVDT